MADIPEEELMNSGHNACPGCGAAHAMRYMLKALGKKTTVNIPACCWAVIPGVYPSRNLEVPLLYTAFETTGVSSSGIRAAFDAKDENPDVNVVGFAGDGGTADIGIQALSGAVERGTDTIQVMYDNEAYMNTGIQRSGSTPVGAWTTTTPVGSEKAWKKQPKKDMMEIMESHNIPYAATVNVAYPDLFIEKFKKAAEIDGPKFIHIYAPCPTGWRANPNKTIELGELAFKSKVFPLYEIENGVYNIYKEPKEDEVVPVKEYLKPQGRFRHLPKEEVEMIQKNVDRYWERLKKKEKFTQEELYKED
ncbi:MAG: 3-methyl-2-oxobutanoate dehydrogenase subunit beta [Thermoplasmata archaeon]